MKSRYQLINDIKKAYKRPYGYFSWFFSIFILLLIIFIFVREPIFRSYFNSKIDRFNKEHNAEFTYKDVTFSGFSKITFHGLKLSENNAPPLLNADLLSVKVSLWRILFGRISIKDITLSNCNINIIKKDSTNNYRFLFKSENKSKSKSKKKTYITILENLMTSLFDKVPEDMYIKNLIINSNIDNYNFSIGANELKLENNSFKCSLDINDNNKKSKWIAEGFLDKSNENVLLKLYAQNKSVNFGLLAHKYNGFVSFDTLNISLNNIGKINNKYQIKGLASVDNFSIYHKRIDRDTVFFNKLRLDYVLNFGKDFIELDSATNVIFNKFNFNPYVNYRPEPSKKVVLSVNKTDFPADNLFSSLPKGLFENFKGIKVSGQLSYNGYFEVDLAQIYSLKFESNLSSNNFKVEQYGVTDFRKMNGAFKHIVYQKDRVVRQIIVGNENPDFRTITQIPENLKNAILISEDPSFFWHQGFLISSFRLSIAKNIKEKKFARGGSTISMQLVKNVFLNQNKNIARKAEEALIVWLIENQHHTSKERMFEVYLNIIEWGPGVYGAGEAARFYFNKDVSELTLEECIFLATIVPRPRGFMYLFNDDGVTFKEYVLNYYNVISKRLLEREKISQTDFDKIIPKVDILGKAKDMIKIKVDTTIVIENELF